MSPNQAVQIMIWELPRKEGTRRYKVHPASLAAYIESNQGYAKVLCFTYTSESSPSRDRIPETVRSNLKELEAYECIISCRALPQIVNSSTLEGLSTELEVMAVNREAACVNKRAPTYWSSFFSLDSWAGEKIACLYNVFGGLVGLPILEGGGMGTSGGSSQDVGEVLRQAAEDARKRQELYRVAHEGIKTVQVSFEVVHQAQELWEGVDKKVGRPHFRTLEGELKEIYLARLKAGSSGIPSS